MGSLQDQHFLCKINSNNFAPFSLASLGMTWQMFPAYQGTVYSVAVNEAASMSHLRLSLFSSSLCLVERLILNKLWTGFIHPPPFRDQQHNQNINTEPVKTCRVLSEIVSTRPYIPFYWRDTYSYFKFETSPISNICFWPSCWPCIFLPCCITELLDVTHTCPNCKRYLDTFRRANMWAFWNHQNQIIDRGKMSVEPQIVPIIF